MAVNGRPGAASVPKAKGTRVILALGLAVAMTPAAFAAWPLLSDYLAENESPSSLAFSEPSQEYVIDGNLVYLEGSVPSEDVSNYIEAAVGSVLSEDRVVNNFKISSEAAWDPNLAAQFTVKESVLFSSGGSSVAEQYEPLIALTVEILGKQPSAELTVIGHTDSIGDAANNKKLSLNRAASVAEEIELQGIEGSRLHTRGMGEARPIAPNDTEEGRAENRRVEFLITGFLT